MAAATRNGKIDQDDELVRLVRKQTGDFERIQWMYTEKKMFVDVDEEGRPAMLAKGS